MRTPLLFNHIPMVVYTIIWWVGFTWGLYFVFGFPWLWTSTSLYKFGTTRIMLSPDL